jgi:hypothetical protein
MQGISVFTMKQTHVRMCLVIHVFLQVNSCLISKMKGVRYKRVKEEKYCL